MKNYKLNQIEQKRILGRVNKASGTNDEPAALFWGASCVEVNVKSNEVWALISADYCDQVIWVCVEVNGAQVSRFIAPKEKTWICISRGMNPERENLITIYKDCQPMPGDNNHCLFIHEIGLADNGEFAKIAPRKLSMEFIGDSITSGEGLAGKPSEMDWITQWMCASKTYAVQTAKALDADISTISQCGWGICWGWDGNMNSTVPSIYNKNCGFMWGEQQKHFGAQDDYEPVAKNDYVVINLGTNDNEAFNQPAWKDADGIEHPRRLDADKQICAEDGKIISDGVCAFLQKVRSKNPYAKIIWVWGMIKLTAVPVWIADGIERYKKESGDSQVYTLELASMDDVEITDEDKGSRGHPGPKTHKLAAEKLTEFIKSL